jgi:hypothetical protein
MMRDQKDNRTHWLHVRLKPEEYNLLQKNLSQTTCRKMSEYARRILLGKPITTAYRNRSLDEFMGEMIRLRKELNALGNNFNQAVKKLHALDRTAGFKTWLVTCEAEKKMLLNKVDEIKSRINQIADQWLANP